MTICLWFMICSTIARKFYANLGIEFQEKNYSLAKYVKEAREKIGQPPQWNALLKNQKVHKYPVPVNCKVNHAGEPLLSILPQVFEKCEHCFDLQR